MKQIFVTKWPLWRKQASLVTKQQFSELPRADCDALRLLKVAEDEADASIRLVGRDCGHTRPKILKVH